LNEIEAEAKVGRFSFFSLFFPTAQAVENTAPGTVVLSSLAMFLTLFPFPFSIAE